MGLVWKVIKGISGDRVVVNRVTPDNMLHSIISSWRIESGGHSQDAVCNDFVHGVIRIVSR